VGLQFQINIQVLDLRAIVTFARGHIRQHQISTRVVRVPKQRLMHTLFGLVQTVQLPKCLTQDGITFGRRVLALQSSTDYFLCLVRPSLLAQKVAVSKSRRGVQPPLTSMEV
jgi:hypothetical protein